MTAFFNRFLILMMFITPGAYFHAQDDEQPVEAAEEIKVEAEEGQPEAVDPLDALVKEEDIKRQAIYDKALKFVDDGKA